MRILVGDIGGTKTTLTLAEVAEQRVALGDVHRYASREHDNFESIVQRFLAETGATCTQAAFAVAGPVLDDRSQTTNLPWSPDARALERALDLSRVRLLNDLEAIGWGLPALADEDLATLYPGAAPSTGNACIVAAGTGLGQAGLYWDGSRHHPFATEGGHGDFAPTDTREQALFEDLRQRFGHVSWERVVSGPGIANIHRSIAAQQGVPAWFSEETRHRDVAEVVAEAAAQGRCPQCIETMELFLRLYGREAGNMALKQMALGGVYLGGGIAPKNLEALRAGPFLEAFFDKGRLAPLMRRIPVRVILSEKAPLYGAARFMAAD